MKLLWITNTIFPEPSKALGLAIPVGGGWMYSLAKSVSSCTDIQFAVATLYEGEKILIYNINKVRYFLIPSNLNKKNLECSWKKVNTIFEPDLVHIHGTELSHGLVCMKALPTLKCVVSVQGLVSVIARYYLAGISRKEIIRNITFRDLVKLDNLYQAKAKFTLKGRLEKEYLKSTKYVIGRTNWDYAHSKSINSNLTYFFNNESLRECFYDADKWDIKRKVDFTIFISQSEYPIKGLHQVLKAIANIKSDFPNILVKVAGHDIVNNNSFNGKIRRTGYGSYLRRLIQKLGLQNHVHFTGILNEDQMVNEFKNSHIFICPSSIENSPNSLGEAQILGVPCIAAYVGGIPDMISHMKTGLLYRFEEVEMLSDLIKKIFNNDELASMLSINEISVAEQRHNRVTNLKRILEIYQEIISE